MHIHRSPGATPSMPGRLFSDRLCIFAMARCRKSGSADAFLWHCRKVFRQSPQLLKRVFFSWQSDLLFVIKELY